MKNKEVEELLNELKEVTNSKKSSSTYCITNKHWQLLLSYIEQLKKRNKELYEGFMATQEELTDYATENEQLENNRDKAITFGNGLLLGEATFEERHIANKFLKILKGDSDD